MPREPKPWYWKQRDVWCVEIGRKRHVLAQGRGAKREAHEEFHRLMVGLGRRDRAGQAYKPIVEEMFDEFLEFVQIGRAHV